MAIGASASQQQEGIVRSLLGHGRTEPHGVFVTDAIQRMLAKIAGLFLGRNSPKSHSFPMPFELSFDRCSNPSTRSPT